MFGRKLTPELKHLVPADVLESTLKAVRDGEQEMHAFLDLLLRSKLFVPSASEPIAEEERTGFSPVIVQSGDGPVVVAYTLSSRASTDPASPVYAEHAFMAEADWLLRAVPPEIGMWINPGWDVGLLMPAPGLREFKQDYGLSQSPA